MRGPFQIVVTARRRIVRDTAPNVRSWLVRAARSGPVARRFGLGVASLAWLVLFAALGVVSAVIVHIRLWDDWPVSYESVVEDLLTGDETPYLVGWGVCAALAAAVLLALRLAWVRLRSARLLRRRDLCAFCGHGISGLPLSPEHEVTCPECARRTPAVSSWHEVDHADPARPSFRPAVGLCPAFWTRRRLVLAGRIVGATIGLAALGYGSWWGIRELGIRRDVAAARADRLTSDQLNAGFVPTLPPRDELRPLAEDLIAEIRGRIRLESDKFRLELLEQKGFDPAMVPDPSYIGFSPEAEEDAQVRELSVRLMALLRVAGVHDLADRLVDADPRTQRRIPTGDQTPGSTGPGLGAYRLTLRLNIARMKLAHDAGDLPEFERALASAAAVCRVLDQAPLLIDWLLAEAGDAVVLQAVHHVLIERPPSEWFDALERALSGMRPTPLSPVLDRERLYAGEMLARHFSEAKRVRQGLNAPEFDSSGDYGMVRSILGQELDEDRMRLGRYAENRAALLAVYDSFGPESDLDPFERAKGRSDPGQSDLAMIDLLTPSLQQCLRTRDRSELRHRAVRTMLELERYRLNHGEYPDTLPPAALSPLLRDPFSGRPFGYRRTEPDRSGSGRGYVLWTVGLDGVDNGGAFDEDSWDQALMPSGFGKDMMLNSPRWW